MKTTPQPADGDALRIAYLFTTFPVPSETFLQRELRLMSRQGVTLELHSLWKGAQSWEGHTIHHFRHRYLLRLIWELPLWTLRRPAVLRSVLQRLYQHEIGSLQNLGELLVGLGFAIVMATRFRKQPPHLIHGVWATMPATAAWLLSKLTGIPYSMGAHAYDVFRHGGDCLLPAKVASASLIHTTTEATRTRLLEIGASPERIVLIRRGLDHFPECKLPRRSPASLRLLSAGRMVPKKGFDQQLRILAALKRTGIPFEAHIIGEGTLLPQLVKLRDALDLRREVIFPGWLGPEALAEEYAWADAFLFTGCIAPDGDRDGLPNVIPEAMACGLTVFTTPVSGTTEAITHGQTGFVIPSHHYADWVHALRTLQTDPAHILQIRQAARLWVEENFDNRHNAAQLARALRRAAGKAQPDKQASH